jgi:hypothetical protein
MIGNITSSFTDNKNPGNYGLNVGFFKMNIPQATDIYASQL